MRLSRHHGLAVAISVGVVLLMGGVLLIGLGTRPHPRTVHDPVVTGPGIRAGRLAGSVPRAYQFLNQMMDRHTSGPTTSRLVDGAVAIGDWIQAHCRDDRGPGGYTGGQTGPGSTIEWKSTEHNIDVYAFFRLLARETGNPVWSSRSAWARRFILAMWDTAAGRFNAGTTDNGVTQEYSPQVEDVNSWSYLALRDPAYEQSLDWEQRHLAVTADGDRGVSICAGNRTGMWLEGTAHLADALELSGGAADRAEAGAYLSDLAALRINPLSATTPISAQYGHA